MSDSALILPNELPLHLGLNVLVREGDYPKMCPLADPTECSGDMCDCSLRPPKAWSELAGGGVVPLYTRWNCSIEHTHHDESECIRLKVATGSIEVVPVVAWNHQWPISEACIESAPDGYTQLWRYQPSAGRFTHIGIDGKEWTRTRTLDPLPVPGRDFGIVIDCLEVAS